MPITKSAKKTLRQSHRRLALNRDWKKRVRLALKIFRQKPTLKNYQAAISLVDRAAKKRIIHKNKAGRFKSRLVKLIKTPKTTKPSTKPRSKAK